VELLDRAVAQMATLRVVDDDVGASRGRCHG
jgi:hypothetical protein